MARQFKSRRELGTMADINITPLLDLAFALLIIFLISAPLLEQPVMVQLPSFPEGVQLARELEGDPHEISIAADGKIFVGEEEVAEEVFAQMVATFDRDRLIVVRGDTAVPYGKVARLLEILRRNQITRVVVTYEGS